MLNSFSQYVDTREYDMAEGETRDIWHEGFDTRTGEPLSLNVDKGTAREKAIIELEMRHSLVVAQAHAKAIDTMMSAIFKF
jgi:hypothetical protein